MFSKLIVKRHDSGWSPVTLEWLYITYGHVGNSWRFAQVGGVRVT